VAVRVIFHFDLRQRPKTQEGENMTKTHAHRPSPAIAASPFRVRPGAVLLALCVLFAAGSALAQTFTTIYHFGGPRRDGEFPMGGVTFDAEGNLVGLAALGGVDDNGTIYRLSPPAQPGFPWTSTTLHLFPGPPGGESPESKATLAPSGKIFGTTYEGGEHNLGSVFAAFPPPTPGTPWPVRILHSFGGTPQDGIQPNAGLLPVGGGGFLGVTSAGGLFGRGVVYELTPPAAPGEAWSERVLYAFRPLPDAAFPLGDLVRDAEGNLYGNALLGGSANFGAVYRVSPPAGPGLPWTETVIHSFNSDNGSSPSGPLIIDDDGSLIGTASGGGPRQGGTVFRLTPPAQPGDPWSHEILFAFDGGRTGGSPESGVKMDRQGRLWGTAANGGNGGPNFGGVLFVLTPSVTPGDPWTERILNSFGGPDGFAPTAPVVFGNGAVYGTTTQGGDFGTGTAFEFRFSEADLN
jgi:uncharacterized repeat protein (TIGR03803 family)